MEKAHIKEIFSSIQGEGPVVGLRQLFIRFSDCNLNCHYCDTDFQRSKYTAVEKEIGIQDFFFEENPITIAKLVKIIQSNFNLKHYHSISLTGGEPLLHYKFINEFSKYIKHKMYIETNGTLFDNLFKLANICSIDWCPLIGMDIKLESSTGHTFEFDNYRKFLLLCCAISRQFFVKVIVTGDSTVDEIMQVTEVIKRVNLDIPLILQPVTKHYDFVKEVSMKDMYIFQEKASEVLKEVRIIPQVHKYLSIL